MQVGEVWLGVGSKEDLLESKGKGVKDSWRGNLEVRQQLEYKYIIFFLRSPSISMSNVIVISN